EGLQDAAALHQERFAVLLLDRGVAQLLEVLDLLAGGMLRVVDSEVVPRGRDDEPLPVALHRRARAAAKADERLDDVEAPVGHLLVLVGLERQLLVAALDDELPALRLYLELGQAVLLALGQDVG